MNEWLVTQIAQGFKSFTGTRITASIHMSEELLNELLAAALSGSVSKAGAESQNLAGSLARFVTDASVKVGDSVLVVDVEVRV